MSIDLPDSIDELEEGDLHGLKVILHRLEIEIKWKEKYLLTITEKISVRIDDLERRINEFGRSSMCYDISIFSLKFLEKKRRISFLSLV